MSASSSSTTYTLTTTEWNTISNYQIIMMYATETAGTVSSVYTPGDLAVGLCYNNYLYNSSGVTRFIFSHIGLTAGSSWTSSYASEILFKIKKSANTTMLYPYYSNLGYNSTSVIYDPSSDVVSFSLFVSGVYLASNYVCTVKIYGLI